MSRIGSFMVWDQLGAAAVEHAPRLWATVIVSVMLAIAISDIVWRKVTNKLAATCWLLGCILLTHEGGWSGLWAAGAASAICLTAGTVPYALGLVGAADVKVFAALGAMVGPKAILPLLLYAAFFAGVQGFVALLSRYSFSVSHVAVACLNPRGALDRARKSGQTMPLTVAFCSGAYVILWGGPLWTF